MASFVLVHGAWGGSWCWKRVRRAIDIHEGELVDESAFTALVRQAVALNGSGKSKAAKKAKS